MTETIKSILDRELSHLKIDVRFAKKIIAMEQNFATQSDDHITFLGGNLIGTPPFRFHATDRNIWFDDILEIDDVSLRDEVHSLETVISKHKVRSDIFNITIMYIVHRFMIDKSISTRIREQAMMSTLKYLHYRFIGSLISHRFRYEANREIAEATYAEMNFKYALKREGSWIKLIESRCKDIISNNSIHHKTLMTFKDDEAVQYSVSDVQGRIRAVINKMVELFHIIHQRGSKIHKSSSQSLDMNGELRLKDLTRVSSDYKRYAHSTLSDRNTWIRAELVEIISELVPTVSKHHLTTALEYMVDNYGSRGNPLILKLVDETMIHTFEYINQNRSELSKRTVNLTLLITKLKSMYTSSSVTGASLLKMKDMSYKIVKKAVKTPNKSLLASIRTGCLLYLVLRAFSMNYYMSSGSLESKSSVDSDMTWLD